MTKGKNTTSLARCGCTWDQSLHSGGREGPWFHSSLGCRVQGQSQVHNENQSQNKCCRCSSVGNACQLHTFLSLICSTSKKKKMTDRVKSWEVWGLAYTTSFQTTSENKHTVRIHTPLCNEKQPGPPSASSHLRGGLDFTVLYHVTRGVGHTVRNVS